MHALKARYLFFWMMCLLLSAGAAVSFGVIHIRWDEIVHIFQYKIFGIGAQELSPAHIKIVWDIRLLRVLLAAFSGAGLSLCGLIMQAAVQNPLAEPYLLGVASGASLGAVLAILFGGTSLLLGWGIPFWAFAGAVLATFAVLFLSGRGLGNSTVKLVLAGAVVSAVCTAVVNLLIYVAGDAEGMKTAVFWMMGSLAGAEWKALYIPGCTVLLAGLFFMLRVKILNAMALGEDTAITLGVDLPRERKICLLAAALLTGTIVSFCGIFGFVGLVVPHVIRGLYGVDHGKTVPAVIFAGAVFLVWMDLLSRIILSSGDLPVGILTALVGAPFFMKLLLTKNVGFVN